MTLSATPEVRVTTLYIMVSRFLLFGCVLLLGGVISCSEDIPECPSKMCVLAGAWQLVEVYVDNTKDTGDLSKYKLLLNMPDPSAVLSDFARIQPSGASDSGMWSIQNNGSILRLVPDNNATLTEDWIIEYFTPRKLVLIINRDTGIKDGPGKIEFVLEPV
jgi:hypothetical protein